jgi:glycosyltransferase involved in cell wall biosynthesis
MKIGIDARLISETGVGRYIRNLIAELGKIDRTNCYVVFLRKNSFDAFTLPNARWEKRLADIGWHSVAEQLFMPEIFSREHLDLLHVPYFNVPLFYFGKFVVTIHDLTILHFDTGKATTLPYLFYKIRRLGYYISLLKALFWSEKVIAVSESTKKEILDHFDVFPEHIGVIYEG